MHIKDRQIYRAETHLKAQMHAKTGVRGAGGGGGGFGQGEGLYRGCRHSGSRVEKGRGEQEGVECQLGYSRLSSYPSKTVEHIWHHQGLPQHQQEWWQHSSEEGSSYILLTAIPIPAVLATCTANSHCGLCHHTCMVPQCPSFSVQTAPSI